jgi:protein TIF31
LQIETLEKNLYHVTATPQGFYVNGTTEDNFDPNPSSKPYHSATLLGLLWKLSPRFKDEFPRLIACRTKKHPFEVTPIPFPVPQWISPVKEHTYDTNRAEEALFTILGNDPRIQQREWNEEYQSCRELPSGTMEERIIRDRTLFKIHCDFVDAATKGAKAVVDKCLLPINPVDPEPAQVYIQNNIFFSYAVDSKNLDEKLWNNKAAYVNANNDLKGVIAFNEADVRGIHTLATCIVDYRGYRVIAQSIIPGILQGEQGSKHVYGSIDEGKTFAWNDKYHSLMKEAAKKLNIKEHTVIDKDGNKFTLCCPVE